MQIDDAIDELIRLGFPRGDGLSVVYQAYDRLTTQRSFLDRCPIFSRMYPNARRIYEDPSDPFLLLSYKWSLDDCDIVFYEYYSETRKCAVMGVSSEYNRCGASINVNYFEWVTENVGIEYKHKMVWV